MGESVGPTADQLREAIADIEEKLKDDEANGRHELAEEHRGTLEDLKRDLRRVEGK